MKFPGREKHVTFALMVKPHLCPMSGVCCERKPVMVQLNIRMQCRRFLCPPEWVILHRSFLNSSGVFLRGSHSQRTITVQRYRCHLPQTVAAPAANTGGEGSKSHLLCLVPGLLICRACPAPPSQSCSLSDPSPLWCQGHLTHQMAAGLLSITNSTSVVSLLPPPPQSHEA